MIEREREREREREMNDRTPKGGRRSARNSTVSKTRKRGKERERERVCVCEERERETWNSLALAFEANRPNVLRVMPAWGGNNTSK
jgi:hypothetical protein